MGRAAQGVRIVKLQAGDSVSDMVRVSESSEDLEEDSVIIRPGLAK